MGGGITVLVGLIFLVFFIYLALIPAWGGAKLGEETWLLLKGCFYLAVMGGGIVTVGFGVNEWWENRKAQKEKAAAPPPAPPAPAAAAPSEAPEEPLPSETPPPESSGASDSSEAEAVEEVSAPPSEEAA